MSAAPSALPQLEPMPFVHADWAEERLEELRSEIADLEARVHEVESEVAAAEARIDGDDRLPEGALTFVDQVIESMIAGRAAERVARMEEGETAAAEQILEASLQAQEMLGEARREIAGLLRERTVEINRPEPTPELVVEAPPAAATSQPEPEPEPDPDPEPEPDPQIGERADLLPAPQPVEIPTFRKVTIEEDLRDERVALSDHDEATYEAFWREKQSEPAGKQERPQVLDVLLPMLILVVVLAVGLWVFAAIA